MRDRYTRMFIAIATGALFACSDAAVEDVTAPPLAATPVPPVAAEAWPPTHEFTLYGIPSSIGIRMQSSAAFEDGWSRFVARVAVQFEWANEVSANLRAWLIDKNGATINSGSAGVTYKRLALPVPSGDTTFTVAISTNGRTCGLTGKHEYSGDARQNSLNFMLQLTVLYQQTVSPTTGADVSQPECTSTPPAGCAGPATRVISGTTAMPSIVWNGCSETPLAPTGDEAPYEVCYTVWREFYYYDYYTKKTYFLGRMPIGTVCYAE